MRSNLLTATIITSCFCAMVATASAQVNSVAIAKSYVFPALPNEGDYKVKINNFIAMEASFTLGKSLPFLTDPSEQEPVYYTKSSKRNKFFEFTTIFNDRLQQLLSSINRITTKMSTTVSAKKKTCANG
jgi:hypothetical protein